MRKFLFQDALYTEACLDLHPGLMADLAGRWFCDYYYIPGPAGFFTRNDVARYIADVLNPYVLLFQAHKISFIQNGFQHRNKYRHISDPKKFFDACMADSAADVGTESTFPSLYVAIIFDAGESNWDNYCKIVAKEELSPENSH